MNILRGWWKGWSALEIEVQALIGLAVFSVLLIVGVTFVSLAQDGAIHIEAIPTSTPYPHGYKHSVCTTVLIPVGKGLVPITTCHDVTEP